MNAAPVVFGMTMLRVLRFAANDGPEPACGLELAATLLGRAGGRSLRLEEQLVHLFDELRLPLYRYLICLGVSPAEADEVIQDTFLQLHKHLRQRGREENLRGWVFRVAHNISINRLRRERRFAYASAEEWEELSETQADIAPGPEELLLSKEKMTRLQAAMEMLTPQQQQCFHLRAEGFRYREIAEILGLALPTVAESLRHIIEKLTREISD